MAMLLRSVLFLLSLSLLIRHASMITYRCDDDEIIAVQNFGNDTIRMHCQKPSLCGFRFLKCHYNHSQSYCGGKTNFVAHLEQSTPISPVIHTCCKLTINEDVQIKEHLGNDCFLYDLPDGTNGTTAEELEEADKEGYALLKNINGRLENFADFSGYRLRYFLLRKKEAAQFVIKGVERNEVGYRVTICSIQCQNKSENVIKVNLHDENHVDVNGKAPIRDDGNLNQIKFVLRNLTDDGQWLIATWAEWSHKRWSEWSTERRIEFDDLNGIKGSGHRYRTHQIDNEINPTHKKGQRKLAGENNIRGSKKKSHRRTYKKEDSSDCGDEEYGSAEEMGTTGVAQEKGKLKELPEKLISNGSKGEAKPEEQKLSSLGKGEKLKPKLQPHKITETGNEMNGSVKATEKGGESKLKSEVTTEATVSPSASTTKADRGRGSDESAKVTASAKKKDEKAKKGATKKPKLPKEKPKVAAADQTTTHKKGKSKQTEKVHNLKQKTSDKSGKKEQEETESDKLSDKLKSTSTKSPKSTKNSTRRNQIGHDQLAVNRQIAPPMNCFSGNTKVYTPTGEKAMKEVSVGDFVLVPISKSQLRYERVEMFYHREPNTQAKFVVLETESGRKLILTELHLLPLGDCKQMHESMSDTTDIVDEWLRKSKFAHKARTGDCVFTVTSNHELQVDRIIKVGRQYLKGIYAPMTVEGSIVADGILASCFSQVESHFTQKLVYDFVVFLYRTFGRLIQQLDEPIQHLPTFIDSIYHLGRFAVPFVKY
ncbi:unnamed protein product [Litomosoides sigmodontis]|uniref:Hint domain-containing protein n=1 Tax=Litomosoides sigmodontis TaxID=42156 RepID=A0A3P6ULL2_LITSI|nr:unnamed protein product [Litomosoides sigmodontis]